MSELKTIIDANIKENGNQEITGKTLNYVLNKIAEGTQKDWNESDATNVEYIKGRTHGVTYEHVSVEGTLKELGYVPGEYVSVLHYARDNGVLEGKGLYLGGLLYNPIVGEEYRANYNGPSVYARVVEVEDGYDVQIKGASDTGNLLKVAIVDYKRIDDAYISMDIARKSQVDALEDKVDNLPQGEEFDAEGNYPSLHVGTADTAIDLAGRGESVPAEFGFRASGGKSIKDGRAYIKRIKGNSVVWNQQSSGESLGGDNGTTKALPQGARIVQGHKYLILCDKVVNSELYLYYNDGEGKSLTYLKAVSYKFIESSISFTANGQANTEGGMWWYLTNASANDARPRLIDLTQMFGAGNEPTTIEEYEARKPIVEDEYAYNEGQVIHCNTESIKSVGDNAWDEEVEIGSISSNSGENIPNDNALRPKNYIKILPNEQYHINVPFNEHIIFYDERKQFLSTLWQGSVKTFTTPSNAAYMRFRFNSTYGTTYNHDICIRLAHTGYKTDYEPYWQDILPLPIIRKYFPDGMKKAGTAHDEIRFNKASGKWEYSKGRIKSVDMGDMNWSLFSSYGFYAPVPSDMVVGNLNYLTERSYTKYANPDRVTWEGLDKAITNGLATIGSSWVRYLVIKDSAYTDAATFKAAMAGVILYYEAADWEWVELDEADQNFRDYYNVADFGTEMSQSNVPSAAFSADIIYQFNAVDMIREHELEITELQKVIATMQAQLASLTNL